MPHQPVYHSLEIGLELELVDVGVGDDCEHDLDDEGPRAARAAAPPPEVLDLRRRDLKLHPVWFITDTL